MLAAATSTMPRSTDVLLIVCAAGALVASVLTALADRKDAAHYYETYEWVELADGLHIAGVIGVLLPSVCGLIVFHRDRVAGAPASTTSLIVLAVVAVLTAVAAVAILAYGRRILVPGSLAGSAAGMGLLAALGLLRVQHFGLAATAALGWTIGVGAALVIMIVAFVVMAATDPMP